MTKSKLANEFTHNLNPQVIMTHDFTPTNDLITRDRMRRVEEVCAESGISRAHLMESAGRGVAGVILRTYSRRRVLVLCGPGNNGGDGFVVARCLKEAGWDVKVMAMLHKDMYVEPALSAAMAYPDTIYPLAPGGLVDVDLVVDALFGVGLTHAIEGDVKTLFEILNDSDTPVVSVDIPSGVDGDTGCIQGCAVDADLTVTFGRARPGHYLLPGCLHAGRIEVVDIGIPEHLFLGDRIYLNRPTNWLHHLRVPHPCDHKYTHGACLIIASDQMTGAVKLASMAARRAGAGAVIIACPENAYPLYATGAGSEIVLPITTFEDIERIYAEKYITSVLFGPGAPLTESSKIIAMALLKRKYPLVLDGGALSIFKDNPEDLFRGLHEDVILTPHEGEFSRLFPVLSDPTTGKISRVRQATEKAKCNLVLKGYDTVIGSVDGACVINRNAPPWLATAGSGDVLAGLIAGLHARKLPPFVAAQVGTWIHGDAAVRAGEGMIAEDVLTHLPSVWAFLYAQKRGG